jgi:hypothetical protein
MAQKVISKKEDTASKLVDALLSEIDWTVNTFPDK